MSLKARVSAIVLSKFSSQIIFCATLGQVETCTSPDFGVAPHAALCFACLCMPLLMVCIAISESDTLAGTYESAAQIDTHD